MENYDYEAAGGTIKIEDIARDDTNRKILRKLKANDAEFDDLVVVSSPDWQRGNNKEYCPEDGRSLGWVGYYIGKNTKLQELQLLRLNLRYFHLNRADIEEFFRGVNCNRSIQKISFDSLHLAGGEIFQSLRPFFENNGNLSEIEVKSCIFGAGCARQLSVALRDCNKSLKSVQLAFNEILGDERLVEIIEALNTHTQLERLDLIGVNVGRNECTALENVLRGSASLQELNLFQHNIDDEGVDALIGALTGSSLQRLSLPITRNITARGCLSIACLLENPNCNLEELNLIHHSISDEGALIFANALARNSRLKLLQFVSHDITVEGWSSFSKVLCDTSSINNTYLSNHTLEQIEWRSNVPADVASLLALNGSSENKRQVAIKKILKHHQHFDMQPFLEWELKVLPIAVNWFDHAQSIVNDNNAGTGKHKLGTIYQFIRAMPEFFEPTPV